MQNWCRSDKSAYGWPISSISSIHAKQYALEISCFAFLNIVNVSIDVSLTQNALNDLFIVFFPAFSGWERKATGDGQFRYFQRLVIPLKPRLRYPGLLYKKEEWSYLDFWQPTSQTYLQHCLLIMGLLHLNFFHKIRKSKRVFFIGGPCILANILAQILDFPPSYWDISL